LKVIIYETLIGIYALIENGEILFKSLYPHDPKRIASLLSSQREGQITEPFSRILGNLERDGIQELVIMNSALLDPIRERGFSVYHDISLQEINKVHRNIAKYAKINGFIEKEEDYGKFSNEVTSILAREEVHKKLSDRESLLVPTVQLLEELDTILNNLSGRMREWYGIHFPEMDRRVDEHKDYAKIISKYGNKKNITIKALQEMSFKKKTAEHIIEISNDSMGAELDSDDLDMIKEFAEKNLDLYHFRDDLSEYISLLTREIAPNIAYIAGPLLGAKLIVKAGGLKSIAMMPASTIQVLGAEKALFRALKTNANPPKHGLIFQHPFVHNIPRSKRGSRARSLAAKIAIASRADWFSGDFIADDLLMELNTNVNTDK
jgi:nucleolar protein 56